MFKKFGRLSVEREFHEHRLNNSYFEVINEIPPYFPHFLTNLGKIRCRRSPHYTARIWGRVSARDLRKVLFSIGEFSENPRREGSTFVMGHNKIQFVLYSETVWHFKGKYVRRVTSRRTSFPILFTLSMSRCPSNEMQVKVTTAHEQKTVHVTSKSTYLLQSEFQ